VTARSSTVINVVNSLCPSDEGIPLELFNVSFLSRFSFVSTLKISLGQCIFTKPKPKQNEAK
jgi:hypothetical protein